MIAISNSSPLMYLAKISKLKLLRKIYEKVIIPVEVYNEVINKGKQLNLKEVLIIEEEINKRFIVVKKARKIKKIKALGLHEGEVKAISLCFSLKKKEVLIDDKEAHDICKLLGLKPIRTTALLLNFLKTGLINFDEFKKSLIRLSEEGYFLSIDVFEFLLEEAKKEKK